jgi:exopolyphosphatase/guanosine-5'-triphosphate,3'-diphosphate pyrophosphatase
MAAAVELEGFGAAGRNWMKDEGRATGGLDPDHDRPRQPRSRWGRRSPYGYPRHDGAQGGPTSGPTYAALDLGTNNCRLLVARPTGDSFRVIDAFSRIIRLGEGYRRPAASAMPRSPRGRSARHLPRQDAQPRRDAGAADRDRGVSRRVNGAEFRARIAEEVGLELEIIDRETEATLAATGCTPLIDPQADGVLLFDIGGGSSELVGSSARRPRGAAATAADQGLGVAAGRRGHARRAPRRAPGHAEIYAAMIAEVAAFVDRFVAEHGGLGPAGPSARHLGHG